MKLNVKSDYACRAIEALAIHHPNQRPLRLEEISQRAAVPANYLVQILIELKSQGLVRSHRGKAGGYLLARPPAEITFGQVARAIQGELVELTALAGSACPDELQRAWRRIKAAAETAADGISFEQLRAEAQNRSSMYYI